MRRFVAALCAAVVASAGAVGGGLASAVGDGGAIASTAASASQFVRLGGQSRYETAARVVSWRARGSIPAGPTVRLVSGARPMDAVIYGIDAAPTLYVPPSGPVPAEVVEAFRLVAPKRVEVVGTERQLSSARVRAVVGGQRFVRLTDTDPSRVTWRRATAASTWGSDDQWRGMPPVGFTSARVIAEAAAAVQVRLWHAVVVPPAGPMPKGTPMVPEPSWWGNWAAVVGGTSALATARRSSLLRGQGELAKVTYEDIAGDDRYQTAMTVAHRAFNSGARTVYLVSGLGGADAAATVSLVDGPVLLVPPCGEFPSSTANLIRRLAPRRVVVIGDRSAVCDGLLTKLGGVQPPWSSSARDVATDGYSACVLDASGDVRCWRRDAWRPDLGFDRAPQHQGSVVRGATAVMPGPDGMCALLEQGQVDCWDASGETHTLAPRRLGVVDYQYGLNEGCVRTREGRVWCHDSPDWGDERPPALRERTELGVVKALAMGEPSCVQRVDESIWCWSSHREGEARPFRVPMADGAPVEISSASSGGLMMRWADGRVAVIEAETLLAGQGDGEVVARGATRLLSEMPGCLLDKQGRIDCPDESAESRRAHRELAPSGAVTAATASDYTCAVRLEGAVACMIDAAAGTWADLGDGLYAPRYRPALVLGYDEPAQTPPVPGDAPTDMTTLPLP